MNNVWETKSLVKMNKSDEAKLLLNRLASICAPVMERRGWRVKCLKEFYPTNAGLLGMNVNRGVSILIRLRPGHDKDSFLPWHDILGTMVHELTHMAVGAHSAEFYKLMDLVYDEVEKDAGAAGTEKKSITGAIFMTKSNRLGGAGTSTLGTGSSKAASDAALKRLKLSGLSASSGQRLGGAALPLASLSSSDRRQLAADAAERRYKDDQWCNDSEYFGNYDDDELYLSAPLIHVKEQQQQKVEQKKQKQGTLKFQSQSQWSCQNCETANPNTKIECIFCSTRRNEGAGDPQRYFVAEKISETTTQSDTGKGRSRKGDLDCNCPLLTHRSSSSSSSLAAQEQQRQQLCTLCTTSDSETPSINRGKRLKSGTATLSQSNQLLNNLPRNTKQQTRLTSLPSAITGTACFIDLVDSDTEDCLQSHHGDVSATSVAVKKASCRPSQSSSYFSSSSPLPLPSSSPLPLASSSSSSATIHAAAWGGDDSSDDDVVVIS